jgi:superfamily II DNA/RNA helicase
LPTALLIGSAPLSRQIDSIKKNKPALAVGNPARIVQLVKMKKLPLKGLRFLVLDEGDRLLSEELFPPTSELVSFVSSVKPACRLVACSATFSEKSRDKLFGLGNKAEGSGREWETAGQKENDILKKNIAHWAFFAEERKKVDLLRSLITALKPKRMLVFTSRAQEVGNIVSRLQYHHLSAGGLWGDMDKKARKASMDAFRAGSISVLVSSDLAARGLDIEGISYIIALDISDNPETYIHRAGRTARAGTKGVIASFGNEEELRRLAKIEKQLGFAVYPKELRYGKVCAPEPDED